MVNTARKGATKERRARDELKKEGHMIAFKSIRWRFGCIDFATLFDIVAIKDNVWRFISVKHFGKSNNYLPHQVEINEFKAKHGFKDATFELWIWHSPRWTGRGKNKVWNEGKWDKIML